MDSARVELAGARSDAPLIRTLQRRAVVEGRITLPAVPAMIDDYLAMCLATFGAIGVVFTDDQQAELREVLLGQLDAAFTASPRSEIVIAYDSPVGHLVNYRVTAHWSSIENAYDNWVATREPPYFGTEPDARVWAVACETPDASTCPVLDIGAGTGRNSLALARRGHPVDALEVSGRFADALQEEARQASLGVRVIQRDLFTALDFLPRDYGLIVASEVVSDFRTTDDVRALLELASTCLAPGGRLVINAFVADDGYQPTEAVRQLGQQTYTAVFTAEEFARAADGLPLERVSEESVLDYERAHLPEEAWPPTTWYEGWVSGRDLFSDGAAQPPVHLRWMVYRKAAP